MLKISKWSATLLAMFCLGVSGLLAQAPTPAPSSSNTQSTEKRINYVRRLSDNSAHLNITEQDRAEFDRLSKDPAIVRRLVRSLAPSIYGNDRAKLAVALAMFGGQEKNVGGKHRLRGDINILLLGDPGTAKSQFLK